MHLPHGLVLLFFQMRRIHPGVFEKEFFLKMHMYIYKACVCVKKEYSYRCVYKGSIIQMCMWEFLGKNLLENLYMYI